MTESRLQTGNARQDEFLFRMLGAIGSSLGAILAAYSTYLALLVVPSIRATLLDFDVTLSAATRFVFQVPWLPFAASSLGVLLGVFAIASLRRTLLVASWVFLLLGAAAIVFTRFALDLPMHQLMKSVSGP